MPYESMALNRLLSATASERVTPAGVPLAIAETCVAVLTAAVNVITNCSYRTRPDAVGGAFVAAGALGAAVYTVRTNLRGIDDRAFVASVEQRVGDPTATGDDAIATIHSQLADAVDNE